MKDFTKKQLVKAAMNLEQVILPDEEDKINLKKATIPKIKAWIAEASEVLEPEDFTSEEGKVSIDQNALEVLQGLGLDLPEGVVLEDEEPEEETEEPAEEPEKENEPEPKKAPKDQKPKVSGGASPKPPAKKKAVKEKAVKKDTTKKVAKKSKKDAQKHTTKHLEESIEVPGIKPDISVKFTPFGTGKEITGIVTTVKQETRDGKTKEFVQIKTKDGAKFHKRPDALKIV
jgi:hypothetical protein